MAAGKPIFGALNGAGNSVISESGCGRAVKAGDYKGLAELFSDYMENPEKYADCGKKAREYFLKEFTEEKHFETLERGLQALIE